MNPYLHAVNFWWWSCHYKKRPFFVCTPLLKWYPTTWTFSSGKIVDNTMSKHFSDFETYLSALWSWRIPPRLDGEAELARQHLEFCYICMCTERRHEAWLFMLSRDQLYVPQFYTHCSTQLRCAPGVQQPEGPCGVGEWFSLESPKQHVSPRWYLCYNWCWSLLLTPPGRFTSPQEG